MPTTSHPHHPDVVLWATPRLSEATYHINRFYRINADGLLG